MTWKTDFDHSILKPFAGSFWKEAGGKGRLVFKRTTLTNESASECSVQPLSPQQAFGGPLT